MSNAKAFLQRIPKSDIIKIIVVTTLVYVIVQSLQVALLMNNEPTVFYEKNIWGKLILPSSLSVFLTQFWSIISYMFAENNFWQIVGNMIWLWVFGSVIEDLKGTYRILPIYLMGGIVSGIFFMAFNTFFNTENIETHYFGAMPAILSVVVATVIYKPNYTFWNLFGKDIPIWVFGALFFLLQVTTLQPFTLSKLSLILGAFVTGILYNYGLGSFFDSLTILFRKIGSYIVDNKNFLDKKSQNKYNTYTPFKTLKVESSKIDLILDKINETGIDSLTTNEKSILEKYSKQ